VSIQISPNGAPLIGHTLSTQQWREASFLHWRVDPEQVSARLPSGTKPDLCEGAAWLGLVLFRMVDITALGVPPHSRFGTFPETNVRTYTVDSRGRRGVYFVSLDAASLAVTVLARAALGVRYLWSKMSIQHLSNPDALEYHCERRVGRPVSSHVAVQPGALVSKPTDQQLFLTARFGAHTRHLGRTWWVPNTHSPWPLQQATLISIDDQILASAGFGEAATRPPDSVLYSTGVATKFGAPKSVSRRAVDADQRVAN
jgi:uncharacterized protein